MHICILEWMGGNYEWSNDRVSDWANATKLLPD
jgi:hypothetical protein